jgi:hypothetical protein
MGSCMARIVAVVLLAAGTAWALDPFEGIFANEKLSLELKSQDGGYTGQARFEKKTFPVKARVVAGRGLAGTFESEGEAFEFKATIKDATMMFTTGKTTYLLTRESGAKRANPLDNVRNTGQGEARGRSTAAKQPEAGGSVEGESLAPSQWEGEISGNIENQPFHLPVTVELGKPIAGEKNPVHLFIGAGEPSRDLGHVLLMSANQLQKGKSKTTIQYLAVKREGNRILATMTDSGQAEAAAINGFTGPNVSAQQASDLMRDVLQSAWGETEIFSFLTGTSAELTISGESLSGTLLGSGVSFTGTSRAEYSATLNAKRVK